MDDPSACLERKSGGRDRNTQSRVVLVSAGTPQPRPDQALLRLGGDREQTFFREFFSKKNKTKNLRF